MVVLNNFGNGAPQAHRFTNYLKYILAITKSIGKR
jgi:hypothetical protein